MRTLALTPSFSSADLKGSTMRSKSGCTSRNSAVSCTPAALVSTPPLGVKPASASSLAAMRQVLARILRRGVDRVLPFGGEDLGRNLVLDLVEDLQLAPLAAARVAFSSELSK